MQVDAPGIVNTGRDTVNKDVTIFDKDYVFNAIEKAAVEGRLLHFDKKRSQTISAGVKAANLPRAIQNVDFDANIARFKAGVKWKRSGKSELIFESKDNNAETTMERAFREAQEKKANDPTVKEQFSIKRDAEKNTARTDGERYVIKAFSPLVDVEYKNNCKALVQMGSVADLVGNELDGTGSLDQRIQTLLNSFGGNIYTETLGDVAITNSSLRSEKRHGATRDKITAYAAIPQVLQNGVVIDVDEKIANDLYRIIVAAPITIANKPYIMGVMVQRNKVDQRLYLHDVVIKKEVSDYQSMNLNTAGSTNSGNLYATELLEKAMSVGYSVLQNESKSKDNSSAKSDNSGRKSLKIPETDADTSNADIAELLDMLDNEEASEATKLKLAELREKYGVIPKGEKPFRDVELPERTAEDKYVSQTVRTILEAKATPEIALKPIEALVAEGEFSYDRYTDKAAQADAEAIIKRKGWAIALGDWLKWSRNGFISKQNTALGWKLYNNSVNSGDMETALEILSIIANNQRNAAQALQATRILKKLSPETQLYQAQRSVESLQNEINARHRKDGDAELKINEDLARQFMESETQEARDACLLYVFSMVYSS